VRYLYALGNEFRTIKFGLERITTLLEGLDRPQDACRFIHVAGTNGKGSTSAMIERSLREHGLLTGLYTSPHLVEPTERVRIAGRPASHEDFCWAFDRVHDVAEELIREGEIDMHPTYFETITAMGFLLFQRYHVEVAVLEVGMGGRLDATNVVDPLMCVITPIDFDHERYLGDTIPKIAFEKAGILKPNRRAVFARQHPEALDVLERRAREVDAIYVHATDWEARDLELTAEGSRFRAAAPWCEIEIECPLIGAHQVDNALTAIAALDRLDIPPDAIRRGIAATRWPGRLEKAGQSPLMFLDGAHNPAGAAALAAYIRRFHLGRKIWMVFGAMRDKDLHVIGPLLFPLASELIFVSIRQTRAYQAHEIREISGEERARLADEAADALRLLKDAAPEDVIFVTGSLYLVGEIRGLLGLPV
jgi:dihydrofolate synthase/folylpolyglutamate synthase